MGNAVSLASANKHHLQRLVPVSQNGLFGPAVKRLQEHLGQLGIYAGTLDRDFGSQPERAVKEFQRRLGFLPNGKDDPKTSQAIQSALGLSLPGPTSWLKMVKTIQESLFAEKAADPDRPGFSGLWYG